MFLTTMGWVGIAHAQDTLDSSGSELLAAQVQALEVEPVDSGVRGEVSLVLLETPERDLPLIVRLDPGEITLDDNRLDWSAVADPLALQPRLRASFTAPTEAGRYAIEGSVEYYTCTERWCRLKRGRLQWVVEVRTDA